MSLVRQAATFFAWLFQITYEEAAPIPVQFLYAKEQKGLGQDANESHLEAFFYTYLKMAEASPTLLYRGQVSRQPSSNTPGRSDLLVRFGRIGYVIEVKADSHDCQPPAVRNKYLAQAQAYAAGTQGVSFLFVLDTTPKQPTDSLPSALNYCYVDRRIVPNVVHQDSVIVFTFPANRYLPSTHSRKSRRK
jgi:hypothetical protein